MSAIDASVPEEAGGGEVANAVSQLQEYVQSCSSFSPHTKILTWGFEQQLDKETLQFRATVSFMFNCIPHHFCGGWQSSKKKAQRDTAERVKSYLARSFDPDERGLAVATPQSPASPEPQKPERTRQRAAVNSDFLPDCIVEELWSEFEGTTSASSSQANAGEVGAGPRLTWEIEDDSAGQVRATVSFYIHTVPHHFAGGWCSSPAAARVDASERVLWYFGKRTEGFVPANRASAASSATPSGSSPQFRKTVPSSPSSQTVPAGPASPFGATTAAVGPEDTRRAVEDKTVLMQVQNALQKSLAKETPPGERVWIWSYEPDTDPQLFRAHVEVPGWGQRFVGDWCKGKKLAQRNACLVVKAALERRLASIGETGSG